MIDPHAYSITVRRSDFEGDVCFEARVKEFPDIAEYADTFEDSYILAIDAIEATAEIFGEKGKNLPELIKVLDEYSGRVTLRLPKTLHRTLATSAENECVSLNQYLVSALSYLSGCTAALSESRETYGWYSSISAGLQARARPIVNIVGGGKPDLPHKVKVINLNNFAIANNESVY